MHRVLWSAAMFETIHYFQALKDTFNSSCVGSSCGTGVKEDPRVSECAAEC